MALYWPRMGLWSGMGCFIGRGPCRGGCLGKTHHGTGFARPWVWSPLGGKTRSGAGGSFAPLVDVELVLFDLAQQFVQVVEIAGAQAFKGRHDPLFVLPGHVDKLFAAVVGQSNAKGAPVAKI